MVKIISYLLIIVLLKLFTCAYSPLLLTIVYGGPPQDSAKESQ